MARSTTYLPILGWLIGRKAKSKARSKKKGYRRYIWMLLALITGSGGAAGFSEYDVLRSVWHLLKDRIAPVLVPRAETSDATSGSIAVYFTKPEQPPDQPGDIARSLVGYIDATERTLDVAAFELDNRVITEALVRAVKRGIRVRLVTETNYLNESGVKALQAVGVPVVDDKRDGALMHNKFMVFDRKAIWTGSMNFTENCAYRNNNNGLFIPDVKLAENYATKFTWMFELRKFGGAPDRLAHIPNPVVKLADGTQIENYFSTHDQPSRHIIDTIKLARRTVHFLAFSFTHDGIGRAMLEKAQAGVEVGGVFEKTQTAAGHSEYSKLKDAGLAVYLDGNPRNMHHKVIVIDSEIVIVGSFNFSESADKSNDENLLIIYSRAIAAKFEEEIERVVKVASR